MRPGVAHGIDLAFEIEPMAKNPDKASFVVYGLAEVDPFSIRYVGRTSLPLQDRFKNHLNCGARAIKAWISTLPPPGPVLVVFGRVVSETDANALEKRTIARLLEDGADLLNVQDRPDSHEILSARVRARLFYRRPICPGDLVKHTPSASCSRTRGSRWCYKACVPAR